MQRSTAGSLFCFHSNLTFRPLSMVENCSDRSLQTVPTGILAMNDDARIEAGRRNKISTRHSMQYDTGTVFLLGSSVFPLGRKGGRGRGGSFRQVTLCKIEPEPASRQNSTVAKVPAKGIALASYRKVLQYGIP